MSEEKKREHKGLSPSSYKMGTSCMKSLWHKINKTPTDPDQTEDSEALAIGKVIHKAIETRNHDLAGFSLAELKPICEEFSLSFEDSGPMLFAMLSKYKMMHEKSGLKAIACEVEVETDYFYGFVDVILEDNKGNYYIGDMKTASRFDLDTELPFLPSHPQMNLYAAHINEIASKLGLLVEKFLGIRYRVMTKSKLVQKSTENVSDYIQRMAEKIRALDIVIPKEKLNPELVIKGHRELSEFIQTHKDIKDYPPNFSNCMSYFRPCRVWSQCHKNTYSTALNLEIVDADN